MICAGVPQVHLPLGELCSLLCALFWAIAILLFRKSGEQVPPVALNLFKGAAAIVLFLATMLVLGTPLVPAERTLGDWLTLLASGAVGIGVADSLFFASLNRLGASGSAVVDSVYSPMVCLCAALYLGDPLKPSLLLAMVLMVSAIIIVGREPPPVVRPGEDVARQKRVGLTLGLVSMLLMAAGIVFAKPVLNKSDVLWSAPVRIVGGELVLAVQAFSRRNREGVLRALRPSRLWLVMVPSAVFGSYLAMVVWIAGMKYTQVGIASVLNQTSTLFVPVLAPLFLKERLTLPKAIAVTLGFAGAVIAMR